MGGLIGRNDGTITRSDSNVDVSAEGTLGGLIGTNAGTMRGQCGDNAAIICNGHGGRRRIPACARRRKHQQRHDCGRRVLDIQTTQATRDVYSGTATSAAKGLTTAQMISPSSFGPAYDFSSAGVWAMHVGATHPLLRWQLAQQIASVIFVNHDSQADSAQ
jgi:hypothetical protein